jgi:hypothetical protein
MIETKLGCLQQKYHPTRIVSEKSAENHTAGEGAFPIMYNMRACSEMASLNR